MQFAAIDVETANADMASICQIGIAQITSGTLSAEWKTYIDPRDHFDSINTSIHGIDVNLVAGAPTFHEVAPRIHALLCGQVVVTHTHFDRVAVHQASGRWQVALPDCRWLDSARVARRAWAELAHQGYGLANVCKRIGYQFQHHDALEDAKAAAQVILSAMADSGLDLDQWIERVRQPLIPGTAAPIVREGNPEGPLYGEVLVFTGALEILRRDAAEMAAKVGCHVDQNVTQSTTILLWRSRCSSTCRSQQERQAPEG